MGRKGFEPIKSRLPAIILKILTVVFIEGTADFYQKMFSLFKNPVIFEKELRSSLTMRKRAL